VDKLVSQIKLDNVKRKRLEDPLFFDVFSKSNDAEQRSCTKLNGDFLHSQRFLHCLLHMKPNPDDQQHFVDICRRQPNINLDKLKDFDDTYCPEIAIIWYCSESFLYRVLNRALRIHDVDILIPLRFFICDLRDQIFDLYRASSALRCYRFQLMSKEELAMLQRSEGELVSVNSFFSTTRNRDYAFFLADSITSAILEQPVVFEIDIDPQTVHTRSFANVQNMNEFDGEDELLFMLGSVFCLGKIRMQDKTWIVSMTLCSDNDSRMKELLKDIESSDESVTNLGALGTILLEANKFDAAERCYQAFLNEIPDNCSLVAAACYHNLGNLNSERGDYNHSLTMHEKCLEIEQQLLGGDHPSIAETFDSIASIYYHLGDLVRALSLYEKALQITTTVYGEENKYNARRLINIGTVYMQKEEYEKALTYYEKALAIYKKILPTNKRNHAICLNNIGRIYYNQRQLDHAHDYGEQALRMQNNSLSAHHLDIADSLLNMRNVYLDKGHNVSALFFYKKALSIYTKSLKSDSREVLDVQNNIKIATSNFNRTNADSILSRLSRRNTL
jgi:tetratricopeptide (TPR) repeat protein